jgi:hypothetical protein
VGPIEGLDVSRRNKYLDSAVIGTTDLPAHSLVPVQTALSRLQYVLEPVQTPLSRLQYVPSPEFLYSTVIFRYVMTITMTMCSKAVIYIYMSLIQSRAFSSVLGCRQMLIAQQNSCTCVCDTLH